MDKMLIGFFVVTGTIGALAVIGLLLAFPIMWCWNYTLPVLFGIESITWGQAWCLHFLASCLIKPSPTNTNN